MNGSENQRKTNGRERERCKYCEFVRRRGFLCVPLFLAKLVVPPERYFSMRILHNTLLYECGKTRHVD